LLLYICYRSSSCCFIFAIEVVLVVLLFAIEVVIGVVLFAIEVGLVVVLFAIEVVLVVVTIHCEASLFMVLFTKLRCGFFMDVRSLFIIYIYTGCIGVNNKKCGTKSILLRN